MKKILKTISVIAMSVASVAALATPSQAALPNKYALSGYFISASTNDQTNIDKLTAVKAIGGDTVITFGNTVKPVSLDSSKNIVGDASFADCVINGAPCAAAVTAGYNVNRVFTFSNQSHWGGAALKCAKDRNIENNGKLYTLLMIPTIDNGCTSTNNTYDLVAVYSGVKTAADPTLSVANAATSLGMKFYAGMPSPAKKAGEEWLPDTSYLSTLGKFTERYMMFQQSKNDVAGLTGFYHHTEMPVSDSAYWNPTLDVYRTQNAAIKKYLPTRTAIVSPYIDARFVSSTGTPNSYVTPAQAKVAMKNLAGTASGVKLNIAIQDGMGTGKGGAYMGNEAGLALDPFNAAEVGAGTWGSKYVAPTGDYYAAAAEGVAGTGAELWANIEGMTPKNTSNNVCGTNTFNRGQSTKTRLDRQIQQTGINVKKNISFMWDPYFTCSQTGGKTLAQSLQERSTEPIISYSRIRLATSSEVYVAGYNLKGSTVTVKYTDASGNVQSKSGAYTWYNSHPDAAPGMEGAWFHFDGMTVKPGTYYMINIKNADGKTNSSFYSSKF